MAATSDVEISRALVLDGIVVGAVSGFVLAAAMGSSSAPFPDFTLVPLGLIGATVGALVGLFLGGLAGLVTLALRSMPPGVVGAAAGLTVGSAALIISMPLRHTAEATQSALMTAGALAALTAGYVWWHLRRS